MPRVIIGKEQREKVRLNNQVKMIISNLPKNNELAKINGVSKQLQSYRKNNVYPKVLSEALKILDCAGYEVQMKQ